MKSSSTWRFVLKIVGLSLAAAGLICLALLDTADYVTEMRKIKHPYEHGVAARRGIEY